MVRRNNIKAEPVTALQPPEGGLSVGYLMGRARASLLSGLDAELARFGLSGMQFAVLKHVAEGSARTAADLCRFMQYDTGAMTRILDRLEEKALVRRERSREDRRTVVLRVTASGRGAAAPGYRRRARARRTPRRFRPGRDRGTQGLSRTDDRKRTDAGGDSSHRHRR
jgi:DNA-binding MarR family transcriptional regulator